MSVQQCQKCDTTLTSSVYCASCQSLQEHAESLDYYALLCLEPVIDIDPEILKKNYLSFCRDVHPDFNLKNLDLAERLSSRLNEAYQTLLDQSERYEYLNKLWGGKSANEHKETPQELLLEMLEWQEKVEDCQDSNQLTEQRVFAEKKIQDALKRARESLIAKRLGDVRDALNEVNYCRTLTLYTCQKYESLTKENL